jgi:hypothetical protein
VIRTIWGLRGSIRATSTMRNGGGSLRARIAFTTTQRCRTLCRTLPDQPCTESFTQTRNNRRRGGTPGSRYLPGSRPIPISTRWLRKPSGPT